MVRDFVGISWRLKGLGEMGELVVVDCDEGLKREVEQGEEEEEGEWVVKEKARKEERESGVVRWEEYLPRMVIRVLLVEADDSTRQIIAALLRKCNYKVAAIPDGLKAWEILKQRHSNIDLILTEVDLPSISGYALLTLIMEHDGCKNIPVIMMSSSDSISMVFKCMLKGAADFLIKPVRRNELKNLWQHVWRRISANNGPGVQNLPGSHFKAEATSKNRATRNCSGDNVSSSRKKSQPNEKASDAQSSCATHYLDAENAYVENMQGPSQMKHQHGKGMRLEEATEEDNAATLRLERVGSSSGRMAQDERVEPASHRNMDIVSNEELNEYTRQAIDLIGTIDNHHECTLQHAASIREMHNSSASPQLELSLCNPDDRRTGREHKLYHSNGSAFSRYSSSKKLIGFLPSSGNTSTVIKGGDKFHEKSVASQDASQHPVNTFSSDEENKSTVMTGPTAHPESQLGLAPVSGAGYGGVCSNYGPMYPPIFGPQANRRAIGLKSTNQKEPSPLLASPSLHSDPGTYCSSLGHSGFDETNSTLCSNSVTANHLHNSAADGSVSQGKDNADQAMVRTDNIENEQFEPAKGGFDSQREAALAKFRQKRKDRCYEKRIRYESRKRLAEQRPRVKGQFVRQV